MAPTSGTDDASLIQTLFREPYRFEFFQAVRLLTWTAFERERARADTNAASAAGADSARPISVGEDSPAREAVRFGAWPSLAFPTGEIAALQPASDPAGDSARAEMTVTFMGLTGPQGVLPTHYTSMLIDRTAQKDRSMLEFFDLFNHRLISLFYRAWVKYRPAPALEHAHLCGGEQEDLLTRSLYSLIGLFNPSLRNHLAVPDSALLYYAGHFSKRPRTAASLEQILTDFLGIPVQVEQFLGHWLPLDESDCTSMPSLGQAGAFHNQLGETAVVGDRVWDVQGAFRLRLGPLDLAQYVRFLPGSESVRQLCQLTRMFVGNEFQFDYVPVLRGDQIPDCRLGEEKDGIASRIGLTAWAASVPKGDASSPLPREDFSEAVFVSNER